MGSNAGSPKFVAVPQMTDNIGTPPQVFKYFMIRLLKFSWFDNQWLEYGVPNEQMNVHIYDAKNDIKELKPPNISNFFRLSGFR